VWLRLVFCVSFGVLCFYCVLLLWFFEIFVVSFCTHFCVLLPVRQGSVFCFQDYLVALATHGDAELRTSVRSTLPDHHS